MRRLLLPLFTAAALTVAGSASAASLLVTYDLSASNLNVLLDGAAAITGTMTVVYTADGGGNIVDGPVSITSVAANLNLDPGSLAAFGVGGSIDVGLNSPVATSLIGNALADTSGDFSALGVITCVPGGLCDLALTLPPSTPVNVPSTVAAITGATVNPLTAPSLITATQTLQIALGGGDPLAAIITLVGNETSRALVPEPGTALLLTTGLAGLGFAGRRKAA